MKRQSRERIYAKTCPKCSQLYDNRDGHSCADDPTSSWSTKPLATKAHARNTDPPTSHAAANAFDVERLRADQQEVLGFFVGGVALTDRDLVARMRQGGSRQSPSGIRTRRKELQDAGFLVADGEVMIDGRRHALHRRTRGGA